MKAIILLLAALALAGCMPQDQYLRDEVRQGHNLILRAENGRVYTAQHNDGDMWILMPVAIPNLPAKSE